MPRFRLTLAYDGRPFAGWQRQTHGNTVQDTLERALGRILRSGPVRIHGSGRTDTGVHALEQVAHFDAPPESPLAAETWLSALNGHLPPTIRVMNCCPAAADFHARYDASGKTYRYRFFTGPVLPPLEAGLAWHLPKPLNFSLLQEACAALQGTHDFAGFAANRSNDDGTENRVRTLWSVTLQSSGPLHTLTFRGSGFLYKMVRLLTGGLMRVTMEKKTLPWLMDLLHRRVAGKCEHLAPPDGLYLVNVEYSAVKAAYDIKTSITELPVSDSV